MINKENNQCYATEFISFYPTNIYEIKAVKNSGKNPRLCSKKPNFESWLCFVSDHKKVMISLCALASSAVKWEQNASNLKIVLNIFSEIIHFKFFIMPWT